MKKIFVLVLLSSFVFACGSTKEASKTTKTEENSVSNNTVGNSNDKINLDEYKEDSLLVHIELGACFGRCPVEKFSIYASGNFTYEGISNTDKIGEFTGNIKASEVKEIYQMMSNLRIEDYPEKFGYAVTDVSTKAIVFNYKGKRKKILYKMYEDYTELKDFLTRVRGIMANGKYHRKVKE
ncbi:MAG: hypothetical protein KDC84_06695 [Crocinitomicaceae bacterium]|nr:hypothetical protein [Crocinitomicaceae bacterium]